MLARHSYSVTALGLVLAVATPAQNKPAEGKPPVPFAEFAADFRTHHDLATEAKTSFADLLDQRYLRARIGNLLIHVPPHELAERRHREAVRDALSALIKLQAEWVRWFAADEAAEPALKAADRLGKWADREALRTLAASAARKTIDAAALDLLGADDEVRAAAATLADAVTTGVALGLEPSNNPAVARLVLAPTRRHFLEVCAFLGSIEPANRASFWHPTVPERAQTWIHSPFEFQLVALEYADPQRPPDDYVGAMSMSSKEATGLLQHVAERGAASLLQHTFGGDLDASFVTGLAQNLVIAIYGENNARSGGDVRGRSAASYGGFVAGGRSEGGMLAGINLESRWRTKKGSDYFVRELRRGLRDASKKRRGRDARPGAVALYSDDRSQGEVVDGPFLRGTAAAAIPAACTNDYLEFMRAYRSGFVHWLRDAAAGRSTKSRTQFGKLLRQLLAAPASGLDAACEQVYGLPLSGDGPKPDNLEWRFLRWLSRSTG